MSFLVLMYHNIAPGRSPDRYTVQDVEFQRQMSFLRDRDYPVLALAELSSALQSGQAIPESAVAITFDDGFESTFEHALPILDQHRMTATFFLVSNLVGRTSAWMTAMDQASRRLITWAQAEELRRRGYDLGSHTCSHAKLTEIGSQRARGEIENSKKQIEDRTGAAVKSFAYPHGAWNDEIRGLVQDAGYECACSTMCGFNDRSSDRFALRRIDIFGDDSLRAFRRKVTFGANRVGTPELGKYYLSRARSKFLGF